MKYIPKPAISFFAATIGALAMIFLFHLTSLGDDAKPAINVDSTPLARDSKGVTSFAPVVKKAAPSVVNIYSTRIVHERQMENPFMNDPVFRQFFGDQLPSDGRKLTRKEQSLGSGVIVSPEGYILTANHVVDGADEIKVAVPGRKNEFVAKVIGKDPQTDVAVLKIDATDLPAVTLGDSDQLEVGDVVLAIGNPFGVGQTVTMGIVSALGRSGYNFDGSGGSHIQDFIQTDAAINPGNSGGALVDAQGRLIGINTAIITGNSNFRDNDGIGFAVPINMARYVMEDLISSGGKITHGYLGIRPKDITPELQKAFGLPDQNGAFVDDIFTNTPAQKAGIKPGDVITEINGKQITDAHSLQLTVSQSTPGSSVNVKLIRNGSEKTMSVKLGELPGAITQSDNNQNNSTPATTDSLAGVSVDNLNEDARSELKIPDNINGAIVTDVDQDSNAAEAGLHVNDVIIEINRQPVRSAEDAIKLCNDAKSDQILLRVWRRDGNITMTTYIPVDNTGKK